MTDKEDLSVEKTEDGRYYVADENYWEVTGNSYDTWEEAEEERSELYDTMAAEEALDEDEDQAEPREQTVRVTTIGYLDLEGKERSVDVAGWGDSVQSLAELDLEFSYILGEVLVERPLSQHPQARSTITVVELRGIDGRRRMFQEFAGRHEDLQELRTLIDARLDAEAVNWRPVEAVFLERRPEDE
jgi:hypothetical protein